ncbi:MAG: DUF4136 domain-containing protein [Novosphingobium sp.]|uniref:DUF4136 domain-containing protein n=1 Tax=Novosphingobium sp. TaxID=1874826 RepID=UPI001E1239FF|nr:DUF4136 domain-containing protein [Novosphingobium sp.]MCB2057766.1 DUF4136 domain-containing protein [Novosphingobium sp.]MCP5385779.1 DUF4136 domain-containing protein [Novosphingobium sp.]HNJ47430.1 DUF4136 domain-containing protein [Novosphingobium sp.]
MQDNRHTPSRWFKAALVPLLLAVLAACATPFNAKVQRFQSQLPAPAGQSFFVVADDPALAGGIEFSQYASLVAARMHGLGYAPAADAASADLIVRFDYGVDKGRDRIRSTGLRDPFWDPWYGYSRVGYWGSRRGYWRPGSAWGFGWYDPWFDGGYESYTVYTSGISMKIDRRADGQRLFEGKAEAVSTSNRLPYLVPNLVEAMFTNFPGNSGETVRISVAPEKKQK